MNKIDVAEYLMYWLKLSQSQVLDKFHSLEGAFSDGKTSDDNRFVYIKGNRADRVLLVAHSDVDKEQDEIEWYEDGEIIALKKKIDGVTPFMNKCLGADDRAGCAALWAFRNSGHSILVTSGEEDGCKVAKTLAKNSYWQKELNDHTFMIEFDRCGHEDLVFYNIATEKFVKYIKDKLTNFKPNKGGMGTDIKYIAKDICGVNISSGYYNQHQTKEFISTSHWINTIVSTYKLLLQKHEKWPAPKNYNETYLYISNNTTSSTSSYKFNKRGCHKFFQCSHCNEEFDILDTLSGLGQCPSCGKTMRGQKTNNKYYWK